MEYKIEYPMAMEQSEKRDLSLIIYVISILLLLAIFMVFILSLVDQAYPELTSKSPEFVRFLLVLIIFLICLYILNNHIKISKLRRSVFAQRISAIHETVITLNHEINNPLLSILGRTQLLLMRNNKLDVNTRKELQEIEDESKKIEKALKKLSSIAEPRSTTYTENLIMIDIENSKVLDIDRN